MSPADYDKHVLRHWFNVSFLDTTSNGWRVGSAMHGQVSERIKLTIPKQRVLKKAMNMSEDSTVIAVSYVGFMSRIELEGE